MGRTHRFHLSLSLTSFELYVVRDEAALPPVVPVL